MPCFHPMTGWRTKAGVFLGNKERDGEKLALPCNTCLGCRKDYAKAWALRCQLELQRHAHAAWTTLTYDEKHVPPTLSKAQLADWLRRLRYTVRKQRPGPARLRFFACGEYGETYGRPHYHAILFGLEATHALRRTVEETWRLGRTQTDAVTPAIIAYTAGYTAKKIAHHWKATGEELVHPDTGEVYIYQPPFLQMSRRPGIAAHAKEHRLSWRHYAVYNGQRIKVPRFLHQHWQLTATAEELETLEWERYQNKRTIRKNETTEQLQAAEAHERARLQQKRRTL